MITKNFQNNIYVLFVDESVNIDGSSIYLHIFDLSVDKIFNTLFKNNALCQSSKGHFIGLCRSLYYSPTVSDMIFSKFHVIQAAFL